MAMDQLNIAVDKTNLVPKMDRLISVNANRYDKQHAGTLKGGGVQVSTHMRTDMRRRGHYYRPSECK